jgi:hypothetical protein
MDESFNEIIQKLNEGKQPHIKKLKNTITATQLKEIMKLAINGNVFAYKTIGDLILYAKCESNCSSYNVNYHICIPWYMMAIEAGDISAYYNLSLVYKNYIGDSEKAKEFLNNGINKGIIMCVFLMGEMNYNNSNYNDAFNHLSMVISNLNLSDSLYLSNLMNPENDTSLDALTISKSLYMLGTMILDESIEKDILIGMEYMIILINTFEKYAIGSHLSNALDKICASYKYFKENKSFNEIQYYEDLFRRCPHETIKNKIKQLKIKEKEDQEKLIKEKEEKAIEERKQLLLESVVKQQSAQIEMLTKMMSEMGSMMLGNLNNNNDDKRRKIITNEEKY